MMQHETDYRWGPSLTIVADYAGPQKKIDENILKYPTFVVPLAQNSNNSKTL